jgi:hypothetical protein
MSQVPSRARSPAEWLGLPFATQRVCWHVSRRTEQKAMKKLTSPPITAYLKSLALGTTSLVLSAWVVQAVPYASCITNSAGTVTYILNQNAQDVKVIYDGGGPGNTNALGAQTRGVHSFSLAGHTSYSIVVTHTDPLAWVKISDETNYNILRYYSPRGVVVSTSPKNLSSFGRIYVANATVGGAGTNTVPLGNPRTTYRGLYAVNPDFSDPYNQGTAVRNAGITFDSSTATYRGTGSPYRLATDKEGKIYVCDYSTNTAMLYRCDPDLTASEQVLAGQGAFVNNSVHTTISDCIVQGSSAENNLVIYAGNGYTPFYNRIMRYDIGGSSLPFNSPPTQMMCPGICTVNHVTSGLDIGLNGKFYVFENRSDGVGSDSLRVYDTDGTTLLFGSYGGPGALGNPDPLRQTRAAKVTPDGKTLVMLTDANDIRILPLDANGLPYYPQMTAIGGTNIFGGASGGQYLNFDAVGNVYAVSSGMEKMVILSPGGYSVAVTSFDGANGSFALDRPMTNVTVTASQPYTAEGGVPGVFTLTREAPDLSQPMTVSYTVTGTAQNGADYTSLPATVVIPATQSSVTVNVQALRDALAEPTETVILTVTASASYTVGAPNSATVYISDVNPAVLAVSAASPTMYERLAADYSTVTLTRNLGDTNGSLWIYADANAFTFGGTAVKDVDYKVNVDFLPIVFNPGDRSITVNLITPLDNAKLDGNRTVIIGMNPGTDPSGVSWTAATNQVTTTILDDEVAPEVVLWSDNFNTDSSANYTVRFAAQDKGSDYSAEFNYDYSNDYVPPAPHSGGDTHGLRLNVNKLDSTAAAAGVNLYPTSQSFGTNFALRFDMYLYDGGAYSTEYVTFGINHDAAHTNWFRGSGNGYTNSSYDGLWCSVEADASGVNDYLLNTAPAVAYVPSGSTTPTWVPTYRATQNANTFRQVFKSPPFATGTVGGGSPANQNYLTGGQIPTWVEVELSQVGNLVSLRMNKTLIMQYANTVASTNGNIMLGYDDAYDSIGDSLGVIYDNVRVVQLFPLTIVTQPLATVVTPVGTSTNLSVLVTGSTTGFTNYQWRQNGVALAGATGSSLALNNAQLANDGVYDVVISDGDFSVTSTPSTVVVLPPGVTLGTGTGLTAAYWTQHTNTAPYTGNPTLTRVDPLVNFDWVAGSPDTRISADYFTTRWVGQVEPMGTETYTFTTMTDDGVRLWVNGQLLVDSWVAQSSTPHSSSPITLTAGNKYDLVMEYFEQTGSAVAKLYWSNATTVGYSPVPQSQLYPGVSVFPTVALTAPASGASYLSPATIQFVANVTTNNNAVKYVSFYNGGTLLANVTNSPYQYSWTGVAAGSYNVSAAVVYNGGWLARSATNAVSVTSLSPAVISGLSNGTLSYSGAAGSQFVLLKTTDLSLPKSAWTRVQTNYTASGSFPIPVGSEAKAFYTIKSE